MTDRGRRRPIVAMSAMSAHDPKRTSKNRPVSSPSKLLLRESLEGRDHEAEGLIRDCPALTRLWLGLSGFGTTSCGFGTMSFRILLRLLPKPPVRFLLAALCFRDSFPMRAPLLRSEPHRIPLLLWACNHVQGCRRYMCKALARRDKNGRHSKYRHHACISKHMNSTLR